MLDKGCKEMGGSKETSKEAGTMIQVRDLAPRIQVVWGVPAGAVVLIQTRGGLDVFQALF